MSGCVGRGSGNEEEEIHLRSKVECPTEEEISTNKKRRMTGRREGRNGEKNLTALQRKTDYII